MSTFNTAYWEQRYKEGSSRWDLGKISPPLKAYFDKLQDKTQKILIPGGGNSYEAEYLHRLGFENVSVVDLAPSPLQNLAKRCPDFPSDHLIQGNFFDISGTFDRIIEQTFFCALNPALREKYAEKTHSLLSTKGKLVGLLFDAPLYTDHPPFGGSKKEYEDLFRHNFEIESMEAATNSVESRQGRELFFTLSKK
jgi:hypothetical protein